MNYEKEVKVLDVDVKALCLNSKEIGATFVGKKRAKDLCL